MGSGDSCQDDTDMSINRERRLQSFAESFDHLDRNREDDGGVFLGADLGQRLQIAQLQRRRRLADHLGSLLQSTGSLLFSFSRYHLRI